MKNFKYYSPTNTENSGNNNNNNNNNNNDNDKDIKYILAYPRKVLAYLFHVRLI